MKYLVYSLSLLLFISSCATQDVCDDDSQSYLVARFKTLDADDEPSDTTLAGLSIYGIREGNTDILLYDSVSASKVALPLDPNNDFTYFLLSSELSQDTLQLTFTSEAYLISYTCGFAARFTLGQYINTGSWIKNMKLISGEVDAELESDETHLWLYF